MTKLNQVLAIEKGVKSRTTSTISKLYHMVQKSTLLTGFSKSYQTLSEDGVQYPPESQKVQVRAEDTIKGTRKALVELFNVTIQKDRANCGALADVIVDGQVVLHLVPVTSLLFLEKQLTDFKTLLSKIPTLDPGEDWRLDEATGLFKTNVVRTTRTAKTQKPIVLYDATEHHPAQTQMITEDVIVGHWNTTKHSGALTVSRKEELLEKAERFLAAVKFAREEANSSEVLREDAGEVVFKHLLG